MNRGAKPVFLTVTLVAVLSLGICGPQASFTPTVEECICLDSTLRFNCTTVGTGITAWTGTVIPTGCQLSLQHNQFADLIQNSQPRFCPGMSIVATPLSIVDNCYNSQLTIRNVSADLNGRTVVCQHDTGVQIEDIGNYTIMLTTEPLLPPNNVTLSAIGPDELTFSWENVAPNCSSLTYEIKASGCGTCPTTTDSTSVTCSGIQLGETRMCNISVRAVTCGNITGDYSKPLAKTLQGTVSEAAVTIASTSGDTTVVTFGATTIVITLLLSLC